ncbi:MAG: hypothetical protein H0X64_01830 [Gemmatimonadaceae bacterium]|nr:hypothetical protein [Gemmatimonadaceae bacterium]
MILGGAQHQQPDHSRGDANTLGGYAAVHDRPAAFEGADGFSYSVEILADEIAGSRWGAYLLFVKWSRIGASSPMGHLESEYIAQDASETAAVLAVGRMTLTEVTTVLDAMIIAREGGAPVRRWWDAMRAEDGA